MNRVPAHHPAYGCTRGVGSGGMKVGCRCRAAVRERRDGGHGPARAGRGTESNLTARAASHTRTLEQRDARVWPMRW